MRGNVRSQQGGALVRAERVPLGAGNLRGIAAMVVATAVFTCGDASMKLVSGSLPTGECVFVRGLCSALLVGAAAVWTGAILALPRAFVPAMGWRCAGDVGSSLFFQGALARMPFADLMGILQMTPLSLTAASALFLGEQVGWRRWTAVAIGLGGALLVIKPGASTFNAWAVFGMLAVLSGTARDIATRRLDAGLSPLLILALSQLAVAGAAFACASFERWATPSAHQLLHLICASVFSLIGHLCVIYSLRSGEISAVAPFRYVGMVWAILLGFAVWHQLPDALSFAGIVVLASAGLYTFYREQQLRRLQVLRAALPH